MAMKNNVPWQPPSSITLPERIWNRLAGYALADDAIRIVAATARNWPELTYMSIGEVAVGDDGLIRFALWSASKCCATLLSTRRATLLLSEADDTWEIKCLVIANTCLTTTRPLSGFLLKPVEIRDGRAARSGPGLWGAHRTPEDFQNRADESRRALFAAFPVKNDEENSPPLGAHPP